MICRRSVLLSRWPPTRPCQGFPPCGGEEGARCKLFLARSMDMRPPRSLGRPLGRVHHRWHRNCPRVGSPCLTIPDGPRHRPDITSSTAVCRRRFRGPQASDRSELASSTNPVAQIRPLRFTFIGQKRAWKISHEPAGSCPAASLPATNSSATSTPSMPTGDCVVQAPLAGHWTRLFGRRSPLQYTPD